MYNTGSIALASSLIKARGTPGFFGDVLKQPFQQSRKYHHPCEPRHLSWQWRPKLSPDVNKCHSSTLKKKSCPEYRFFPRFKKSYIPQDITACEPPPPKPKTWSEYLSFLLPEEVTRKPKPTMCRKMLEHRRRKCMDKDDYTRCIQGECWPLPTEWYGQGVLHISELALSKEPIKAAMDAVKPCPPPAHMISRCIEKKLPVCPAHDKSCLDSVIRKMPYSQFRAAETDGSPPTVTLKCPIKYSSELLPDHRQDKSLKLSCRTYGEFKTVECPKQMFNRYMSVDLNSKNLVPVPITVPGYTPQREVKKGVCGRQSLLRPPSSRNFSTGSSLMSIDYPEFMRNIDSSHLQPGRSVICFDKLAGRAGMDTELLSKTRPERKSGVTHYNKFTEEELEKHEKEARKDEETPEQRQKRADSSKSKLQLLIEKQERERGNKGKNKVLKSAGPPEEPSTSPLFTRMVDLEETPYQRSRFHSSSNLSARKNREDRGSKSSKGSKMKIGDGQICSGCPGVQESENNQTKRKSKCSTSRGGAKGRCRVQRPLRPGEKISPLSVKCKNNENSPCMRPRIKECKEPYVSDLPCNPQSGNNRKFHTSAFTTQSASQPKETPHSGSCFKTVDQVKVEEPECPPLPPKRKCAKVDFEHWNKPKLPPCPRPPGMDVYFTQIATYINPCKKKEEPVKKKCEEEEVEKPKEEPKPPPEPPVDCCMKRCSPHDLKRETCPCFNRPPPPCKKLGLMCSIFQKLGIFCGCEKKKERCEKKCRW